MKSLGRGWQRPTSKYQPPPHTSRRLQRSSTVGDFAPDVRNQFAGFRTFLHTVQPRDWL